MHLVTRAIGEFDFRPQLKFCQKPVLIIHGDHDKLISPDYGEELAKTIPSSRFVLIPRGGHAVITEKPDQINEKIAGFLRSTKVREDN